MRKFIKKLPLSLYIHIPWCVRKCPYCDFNSHEAKQDLPETAYVDVLMRELDQHALSDRPLISIFFGGGTPSLFSGRAIAAILQGVKERFNFVPEIEITLEANPGTLDESRFADFREAGINRLSLGIQSLQNDKLKTLGRIHDRDHALRAIQFAKAAGFTNFNVDLMFGLPHQSIPDALHDLELACSFAPPHLSWYQLTIEPNTLFYHQTPPLPADDLLWDMQIAGQALLQKSGLQQYEVSAYARSEKECRHNRHYWEFGDYLGIGAGAHSKITDDCTGIVTRFSQIRHPKNYLAQAGTVTHETIHDEALIFEFMLNALRLTDGVPLRLFEERTGLSLESIAPLVTQARTRGLLINSTTQLCPTELGRRFLNDLVMLFLPNQSSHKN